MKTITAKEFQTNHASIVKAVREGESFAVTFHRKPAVKIIPAHPKPSINKSPKKPRRGSYEAILESLKYSVKATGDMQTLSYKELRDQMMEDKYGKYVR